MAMSDFKVNVATGLKQANSIDPVDRAEDALIEMAYTQAYSTDDAVKAILAARSKRQKFISDVEIATAPAEQDKLYGDIYADEVRGGTSRIG